MSCAGTWTEVKSIMLDEARQTQKGSITCFLFHMGSVVEERHGSRRELFIEGGGAQEDKGGWFERVRGNGTWKMLHACMKIGQ